MRDDSTPAQGERFAMRAGKPCMMCGHPCPVLACGVRNPCPRCQWPYPHGSCAD